MVTLSKIPHEHSVKTKQFLQLAAEEETDIDPQRKKNSNTGTEDEKKDKSDSCIGTLRRKRSALKKTKAMKSRMFHLRGAPGAEFLFPSLCNFCDTVQKHLPPSYLPLHHFIASVGKDCLAHVSRAQHLCSGDVFDRWDAYSRISQALMIPKVLPLSEEGRSVVPSP